jgi:hypothetical protein
VNLPSYVRLDEDPPVDPYDELPEDGGVEPPEPPSPRRPADHTAFGMADALTTGIGRRDPRLLAIKADAKWLTRFLVAGTAVAFVVSLYAVLLYAVHRAIEATGQPWLFGLQLFLILFGLLVTAVVVVAGIRYNLKRQSSAGGR